jgi:hypothetical protein
MAGRQLPYILSVTGGKMERMITLAGNITALAGILLCAGAGGARLLGYYLTSGFATMTLFQIGTGLMVLACLCKLESLLIRSR